MLRLRPRLHVSVLAGSFAVAVGMGVFLSPPTSANAFGTLGRAEAASPGQPAAAEAPKRMAFPGVPGVDLLAIGYRGVDLDALTVADLDRALPELPTERAAELRARIEVATAHVEGLRAAEYVLYETARSMRRDVGKAAAQVEQLAKAYREVAERADALQLLATQRPGLDAERPVTEPVDWQALGAVNDEREQAATALAEAELHLLERKERRHAHREALDLAHRSANRMDDHIAYLYDELRAAQARMLPAGRWLAEEERGRQDLPLVRVRGFKVHGAIAGSLGDLLEAAEADGIDLRGKAYRSTRRQVELRRAHCGTTDYDVYEKPSSFCSPPTAKPNRSLHESGLAVDFMHGEQSITSRRSPAYRWLAANAASYGFFNLASEPWHWSVSAT